MPHRHLYSICRCEGEAARDPWIDPSLATAEICVVRGEMLAK